jgi:putative membrane protein
MMPWGFRYGGGGWIMMLIVGLIAIVVFLALIALAFFALRALTRSGAGARPIGTPGGASGALAILQERYARGEITKEEYEAMRHDLGV